MPTLAPLTYRTADNTRWGGGNGSDLSATQIDLNFWNIFEAVTALQEGTSVLTSIDYISQPTGGNQFFVVLTNHQVLGPFIIPTSQWNPRGNWQAGQTYAPFDTVSYDGALYLVLQSVVAASTFNAGAMIDGNNVYSLILSSPLEMFPANGQVGQRLVSAGGSPFAVEWKYDSIRLFCYVDGVPTAGDVLLQFVCVDNMSFPEGLEGSVAYQRTDSQSDVSYTLYKNGASIGSINFTGPSPADITVNFPATVACVPGDVITLLAPVAPDSIQSGITFTLVAQLQD